jgi:hypothetical protein
MVVGICIILLGGCAGPKIIPIQMARTTQTESFEQTFEFLTTASGYHSGTLRDLDYQDAIDRQLDYVFNRLLGEKNWQRLKDLYGVGPLRGELVRQQIRSRGIVNLQISIDPLDHKVFYLEGSGRFFIVRDRSKEILLSGDFLLLPSEHRLTDLEEGHVTVDVKLIVSRVPGETTFLNDAFMRYRIFFDHLHDDQQVFSIDYDRRHEVYLHASLEPYVDEEGQLIGHVTFVKEASSSKLIDLRGIEYLRDDYHPRQEVTP